jgi:hypothetical protein
VLRAEQLVRAIADAAERWRDADFPSRVRTTRAIVRRTGYTEPVVDYALDALFGSIDRASLEGTISSELGSIRALDGFVARPGRPDVYFRPVGAVTIVSSDTTIGVAIPAFVFALCAKARVTVKDRDDALVEAFAATLAQELPELRDVMSVTSWDGTSETTAQIALADAVVAYGRDETLAAIRAQLAPEARFIPFGHRTSVGYVARETLALHATAAACARDLATDALLFDGEGCLSIHAAFVERDGALDPSAFAALVADACDDVAIEFPAGYAQPDAAAAGYLRAARFRAAQGAGRVFGGAVAPHAIVLDPDRADPPPFVRRILALYSVDGPDEALAFVRRHALALEAVGSCGAERPDVAGFAVAAGAARLARLGTLQRPPLTGEHGGVGRILPFVRPIYRV